MFCLDIINEGDALLITFKGRVDTKEAKQFFKDARKISAGFKKGFIVVTDLSLLDYMEMKARPFIEKAMDVLNESGVSKVVRIIPDGAKDIGFAIMSLFHYSPKVVIHTCKSYQEAKKYIGEKIKLGEPLKSDIFSKRPKPADKIGI